MANVIDNFTHGAAIGGGFAINRFVGLTTLIGIIIHEIPHEIGDFAILLRSGFDHRQASQAQLVTSLGGVLGAIMALLYSTTFDSNSTTLSADHQNDIFLVSRHSLGSTVHQWWFSLRGSGQNDERRSEEQQNQVRTSICVRHLLNFIKVSSCSDFCRDSFGFVIGLSSILFVVNYFH